MRKIPWPVVGLAGLAVIVGGTLLYRATPAPTPAPQASVSATVPLRATEPALAVHPIHADRDAGRARKVVERLAPVDRIPDVGGLSHRQTVSKWSAHFSFAIFGEAGRPSPLRMRSSSIGLVRGGERDSRPV